MPLAHRKPTCDSATQVIWEDNTILGKTYVYEYDKAGNITKKYTYALTAKNVTPTNPESTYTYSYGDANWGDKLTSYRGESITYDEVGNPLSYYNGRRYNFTWENGRRLATATVDGVTLTFTYNADGIRTSKTVGGSEHIYHLNGTQIITETWTQGQSAMIYLYDAEGSPIGMKYRDGNMADGEFEEYWFEKNLQGDIVAVYDAAGNKHISYTYDAWGNFSTTYHDAYSTTSHADLNPFRYRGYYYDSELGMYYLQSRYYDPVICRFINPDGAVSGVGGELLGCNMYVYGFNNPVIYTDYDGNWPKLSKILTAVAVTALTVATVALVVTVCAVAAPAVITVGGAVVSTAAVASAATTVGTYAAATAVCASVAALASQEIEEKHRKSYSVYFLEDEAGIIQYVGRVTDSGYDDRMRHHASTRGLTPALRVSGLSYAEARGLEEIGMIECHTLNAMNPLNNQIHGIGIRNRMGERYLNAAVDYLINRAENSLLNILG